MGRWIEMELLVCQVCKVVFARGAGKPACPKCGIALYMSMTVMATPMMVEGHAPEEKKP